MGLHGKGRRFMERPPVWPLADEESWPVGRQRWRRDPEAYEDRALCEPYPGATVLEDLEDAADDATTLRILARFTVIRILLLTRAGQLAGPKLRTEQRVAAAHLAMLPSHDWERRALENLADACSERRSPAPLEFVRMCAEAAAKRSHRMGAFALYRAGYEAAVDARWWEEAAVFAGGISRLARSEEARVSSRVWGWRAHVLETRHAKAVAEAEAAERAAAEQAGDGAAR
jgi:hypothetical protein